MGTTEDATPTTEHKGFDNADEVREFPNGHAQIEEEGRCSACS